MRLLEDTSNYIKLTKLKRIKNRFEKEHRHTLDETEHFDMFDVDKLGEREWISITFNGYQNEIRALETIKLRRLADKWGIRIEKNWIQLAFGENGKHLHMLSDEAVETITATIRQRRRENIEWWVSKVIVPIIGALTGLIGVLLAIYALKSKG